MLCEAAERNIELELIQAVVWAESKYKNDALSPAGAVGLMQLLPSTAKWCCEMIGVEYKAEKLAEPEYNIMLGSYYLGYLLNIFSEKDAIAAYNAGQGNVMKWKGENLEEYPFKETREYVERVLSAKNMYVFLNSFNK